MGISSLYILKSIDLEVYVNNSFMIKCNLNYYLLNNEIKLNYINIYI